MLKYLIRRMLFFFFLLFAVSSVVFFLPHLMPGKVEPMAVTAGFTGTELPGRAENLSQSYIDFMGEVARFRFGISIYHHRPVSGEIFFYFPNTVYLSLSAMFLAMVVSLPLAVWPVLKKNAVAGISSTLLASIGQAVPNFILGPVLILVFSVSLGWFPVSGSSGISAIVLPAVTLGLSICAVLTRMIRQALEQEMEKNYVLMARAKGLGTIRILGRHVLKNVIPTVLTVIGLQLGTLLCGTIITETVFSWQGIGRLLLKSIQQRDVPMIQGLIIIFTFIYLAINLTVDTVALFCDPRRRMAVSNE